MRVTVDIVPSAVADFAAWRESLDTNPFVQRRLATAYTDALFRLLIDTRGLPTTGRTRPPPLRDTGTS